MFGCRHLVVGFAAGTIPKIPLNLPLLKRCSIVGVDWGGYIRANPADNLPLLRTLTSWIAEGRIDTDTTASFPLEEATDPPAGIETAAGGKETDRSRRYLGEHKCAIARLGVAKLGTKSAKGPAASVSASQQGDQIDADRDHIVAA